jgi:glycosyltransferase involved in cell wall biosynthesis
MPALVSILLPCYNAEKYLDHALTSIRNQDHRELEIICVDDGSTDSTGDLLLKHQQQDNRIKIITHPKNRGLIAALNNGLQHINGDYFARMDQDDYSPPERISTQLKYLQRHPSCELVSSGYYYFRSDGKPLQYVPPVATTTEALRFISLFATPLNHPAVFGRTSLLRTGKYYYVPAFPHCEDFELFSRLLWQGVKLENISSPLHWMRLNADSSSVVYHSQQVASNLKVTQRNMEAQLGQLNLSESLLRVLSNRVDAALSEQDIWSGIKLLNNCYGNFVKNDQLNDNAKKEARRFLDLHVLNILLQSAKAKFRNPRLAHIRFAIRLLMSLNASQFSTLLQKIRQQIKNKIQKN